MAYSGNTDFFSPKELSVGVAVDATNVGTAASTVQLIEADSVSFPSFNDTIVERRANSGSGLMVATGDINSFNLGNNIEFSVSGYLTDTLMAVLLPNALSQGFASDELIVDGTTSARKEFEHGDAVTAGMLGLTFAFSGGTGFADCVVVSGCVCTSFSMSADPNEDGGRMKFDASYTSRTPVSTTWATSGGTLTALSSDYIFLGDYSSHVQVAGTDVVMKSFAMTIENPVTFSGFGGNGVDGAPQQYLRSIPEMNITLNPVLKYDTNLAGLWAKSRTMADVGNFEMSDNAVHDHASATRTIHAEACTVQSIGWDEGDYLGLSLELKVRGDAAESFYVKHA